MSNGLSLVARLEEQLEGYQLKIETIEPPSYQGAGDGVYEEYVRWVDVVKGLNAIEAEDKGDKNEDST